MPLVTSKSAIRKTKILATLGPASNSVEIIKELILAGMDASRINFSHGTYETHTVVINNLKQAREELNAPIPLILDTKGPEIRIKTFSEELLKANNGKIYLKQGQQFTLTTDDIEGDEQRVSVTYANLPNDLSVGKRILIDDGLIELHVDKIEGHDIICTVVNSGFLSSRKGVNVPDVYVNLPSLTEKDIEDIKFGIKMGFDYIAASFVRSAKDVVEIRQVLEENGGAHMFIIAKIESRDGVNNLDKILEVADGIMVARGDLGVEIPPEEVPLVQKMLIQKANTMGKPVITATQMLESMVNNPRPTRAEANDVANAIFDGSDAIMLSGETANGKYPASAVSMMSKIALKAESAISYGQNLASHHTAASYSTTNAISYATCNTAADLGAACIATVTHSGFSARMVAKNKPTCPILAVTSSDVALRQLNLVWGCIPIKKESGEEDPFAVAAAKSLESKLAVDGDLIVIVAGIPIGIAGSTNCIKVQLVGDILAKGKGIKGRKSKATGHSAVVKVPEEMDKYFKPGDILVTTGVSDSMLVHIGNASAVVVGPANSNGDVSQAITACKVAQIPCLICRERVVDVIRNDVLITVDSEKGFVYNGAVE